MNKRFLDEEQWSCAWCGTRNPRDGRFGDGRCLACRKSQLEAPLAVPEKRAGDEEVWALFTRGYFHEIATAAAEGKISYAGSGLVRWAIILALTEQLWVMDTYLTRLSEDPSDGSGLGWVWPQASYVSGVTLHLQKSGPERRQQFERQARKKNRAVNLVFESSLDSSSTKVRASLFFKGERRIESRPRDITFEVETLRV
jgi:hypothetical protein